MNAYDQNLDLYRIPKPRFIPIPKPRFISYTNT